MKYRKISLLSFIVAGVLPCALCPMPYAAHAAVKVQNNTRSYAGAYQQVAQVQQAAAALATAPTATTLPITVADPVLANQIENGTATNINKTTLDACAAIYPSGKFAWDKPTAGIKFTEPAQCVAVVELRQYTDGVSDPVMARANIAAGDTIKCNIGDFPEISYTIDAGNVTFPADAAPTMEDVEKVMDSEQKKNAGFKIAAGAIIGGIGGNIAGKNDPGHDGIVGTSKGKMSSTLVGALSGGSLMAASSYTGKVAGDTILGAGVNAAAGAAMGNMVASGESVLRIENCKDLNGAETKCLWGVLQKNDPIDSNKQACFYNISNGDIVLCDKNKDVFTGCQMRNMIGLRFGTTYDSVEAGVTDQNFLKIKNDINLQYTFHDSTAGEGRANTVTSGYSGDGAGIWTLATACGTPASNVAAMITDYRDKTFGTKMADWYKWRNDGYNAQTAKIVGRNNLGEATALPAPIGENAAWSVQDFYPLTVDADDGGIIDMGNKARLKGTLIGAGAGAGLGAFTSYQGAVDDVSNRWASAVTEYKDSLSKFYCATGTRFLASYNDIAIIPNIISE